MKILMKFAIFCLISQSIIFFVNELNWNIKDKEINNQNVNEVSNIKIKEFESKLKKNMMKMSRLLTNSMKILGQLSCNVSVNQVSDTGGWCANMTGPNSTVMYYFDARFARELGQILSGKTVASFGDGPGEYKSYLDKQGLVKSYDAFDGAPFVEERTNNSVSFLDFTVPIYHLSQYDWVISIEVAEHIPSQFESIYLDNLVRHAKEGVILSWAHPGQLGHSHVNNCPIEYVKQQMKLRGFYHDSQNTNRLKRNTLAPWIRENINVFIRKDYTDDM